MRASRPLALLAALLPLLLSCREEAPSPPAPAAPISAPASAAPASAAAPANSFFDQGKVFQGAGDPEVDVQAVPCVGDAADGSDAKPFHPQKIRGTVWAPFGVFAQRQAPPRPTWLRALEGGADLLSSPVWAHPLPQEKAIAGAEVRLVHVDARGEVLGELLKATTDAEGRFCFRVPDAFPIKPNLVVMVGDAEKGTLMRRNVASRSTNDLFSQPEALFRQLVKRGVDLTRLPRQEFGNLYSLTDTIVDDRVHTAPLDLPEGTRIKAGCALVEQRLAKHPRFIEKVGELAGKYGVAK